MNEQQHIMRTVTLILLFSNTLMDRINTSSDRVRWMYIQLEDQDLNLTSTSNYLNKGGTERIFSNSATNRSFACLCADRPNDQASSWCYLGEASNEHDHYEPSNNVTIPDTARSLYCIFYVVPNKSYLYCSNNSSSSSSKGSSSSFSSSSSSSNRSSSSSSSTNSSTVKSSALCDIKEPQISSNSTPLLSEGSVPISPSVICLQGVVACSGIDCWIWCMEAMDVQDIRSKVIDPQDNNLLPEQQDRGLSAPGLIIGLIIAGLFIAFIIVVLLTMAFRKWCKPNASKPKKAAPLSAGNTFPPSSIEGPEPCAPDDVEKLQNGPEPGVLDLKTRHAGLSGNNSRYPKEIQSQSLSLPEIRIAASEIDENTISYNRNSHQRYAYNDQALVSDGVPQNGIRLVKFNQPELDNIHLERYRHHVNALLSYGLHRNPQRHNISGTDSESSLYHPNSRRRNSFDHTMDEDQPHIGYTQSGHNLGHHIYKRLYDDHSSLGLSHTPLHSPHAFIGQQDGSVSSRDYSAESLSDAGIFITAPARSRQPPAQPVFVLDPVRGESDE